MKVLRGQSASSYTPPSPFMRLVFHSHPFPYTPMRGFWPRIVLPHCRFPVWGRSNLGWGRCKGRNCCWWKWVGVAQRERGARVCQMAQSGGPDRALGVAGQQKVETGMPAGILSCRKACQRGEPPEETRGDHMTVSTACWALGYGLMCTEFRERRREAENVGQASLRESAILF